MRAVTALLLGLAILAPATARAEPASDALRDERAGELFKEGVRAFDAGDVAPACDAFAESLRLGPKLGTLLNLALCHEHQGRMATAWSEYAHGAAWATELGQNDRREFAHRHAVLLEAQLARVELELPPVRDLSRIDLDGEPLPSSRWFLPLFLDPGEHTMEVTAGGKAPRSIRFVVSPGRSAQTVRIPALLDLPREIASPAPSLPKEPSVAGRNAGFVAGGIGIAGLAVGAIFGARTLIERDDIGAHCAGNTCDAEGLDIRDAARASATVADIAFAIGLVGVGIGSWLLVRGSSPRAPKTAMLTW